MKKIIVIFFIFFITISKVSASARFYVGEKIEPNFYVERIKGNNRHNGLLFKLLREDGEFVYCIDPFETRVSETLYTEYDYNNSRFNITDDNLDLMNKIAYFGYGYGNHTDIKWYGITQFLIWQKLNLTDVFLTDYQYGNRIEPYNKEISEIYSLIDEYNKLPSFANKTIIYNTNKQYELIDTNNVLDTYDIFSSDLNVSINNNILTINTTTDGIYNISFIKRSPINRNFKLYYATDTQSFIYPGRFDDIKFELKIEVISGSIKINKIGNNISTDSTLEGANYGIFENGIQIKTIITNNKGEGFLDDLPIGKYTIKELVPPKGYLLDNNIYEFEISKQNRNIYMELYDDLIYDKLIINKYYGEPNNYKLEDGAEFNIYDSKYNLYKTVETVNGNIDIDLPYGTYKIVQINSKEGYNNIQDFSINIDGVTNNTYNLYDELIKGDLVLNKYNMDLETCEKEDGAVFEIYKDNTLYGTYETINGLIDITLPYGKYLIKQTKGIEGYKYVDDFEVFINEENKYEYDLYNKLIYGNLIINKYYGDNIKEDGAVFKVSNETINYEGETTDGKLSMELPYGTYQVTQLKGIEGYKYVEDFNVSITDQDSNYDLYDEIIVNVPDTGIKKTINYTFLIYIIIGLLCITFSLKRLKE